MSFNCYNPGVSPKLFSAGTVADSLDIYKLFLCEGMLCRDRPALLLRYFSSMDS